MNPHQKNKVDVKSLSPEEQRLFRLYGKLPSRSDHFSKHLKERKYFDSGDYAMSKAGKGDGVDTGTVGSQHPVPENIPHLSSPANANSNSNISSIATTTITANGVPASTNPKHPSIPGLQAGSPIKESSFLKTETSIDEVDTQDAKDASAPAATTGEVIPIRR